MKVLVTGANGVVGGPLYRRCREKGLDARPAGRTALDASWVAWDMAVSAPPFKERFECVLHTAPLWLLAGYVRELAEKGVNRIVCYSSTSVVSKETSTSRRERALADALARAEAKIFQDSIDSRVDTTVFRPTMIYGFGRDGNVSAIANFIARYGFFPVAGAASGRRQPVHTNDVADAALAAISCARSFGKIYCLTGLETLTYRAMVLRIFDGLGRPRRVLRLPVVLYKSVLDLASVFTKGVSGAMAARMNVDLVFDSSDARRDIAFSPQGFLEHPERDLA